MTVKFEEYEDAVLNDACFFICLCLLTTIHMNDSQIIYSKQRNFAQTEKSKILTSHSKKQTSACDIRADEWVNLFS